MMYLIGLIVCFDADQGTFRVVDLPGQLRTMIKTCLQYTAGPHPRGDLMVVYVDNGMLVRWVLTRQGDMAEWNEDASLDLAVAFGHMMNPNILEALSVQPSDWRAIQVRSVSSDGRCVLISVGVFYGIAVADMSKSRVHGVQNLHKIGRVFPLSENWPPRP
uniref:Uncharacterized protein n=1 Tax=Avena sativa TaxID=4498 RepID=A0ACD5WX42_AVESA